MVSGCPDFVGAFSSFSFHLCYFKHNRRYTAGADKNKRRQWSLNWRVVGSGTEESVWERSQQILSHGRV